MTSFRWKSLVEHRKLLRCGLSHPEKHSSITTLPFWQKNVKKNRKNRKKVVRDPSLRPGFRAVPALCFWCEVYHSTQNESLYSENRTLFWKNVSRISQNQKYRIFQKRFLRVFLAWEGQITSDKDETCSDCTPSPPLQNEILADPPGFEIKKLRA